MPRRIAEEAEDMSLLKDKAVVITGAGRGLGRAYALAASAAGAAVVLNDIDGGPAEETAAAIRNNGGRAITFVGSAADWSQAEQLISVCVDTFGAIDGLISNGALFYSAAPVNESEQQMRTIVEANVLGPLFCGVHALNAMYRQGRGAIVNVTSGSHLGMDGLSTYGATKGAIASLTYGWALETASRNIRVNAISPLARTRMGDGVDHPQPNQLEPEAVAPAVVYLLSDLASFSGQVVRCDGRSVSFLHQPRYSTNVVTKDSWSPEEIAEAVTEQLSSDINSVGWVSPDPGTGVPSS
jgi:NAD(P)-dependent dehydrogenase (short-subunit alcohol dehydrogenase family)